MDDCNKCDSPGGSNTDSLIEKFRFEITKKSDEDLLNIKKLTIQASNKSREFSLSNRDIDKKISDLECLILKLQEELNDLSSASKQLNECKQEDECEVDYCSPVVNECDEPTPCSEEPVACLQNNVEYDNCKIEEDTPCNKIDNSSQDKENIKRSSSNRFPIILRDIGNVQDEEVRDDVNLFIETIFVDSEQTTEKNDEEIPNTRQAMFFDWKKDESKDEEEEENKSKDDITNMIAELRAEMDETIHALDDDH